MDREMYQTIEKYMTECMKDSAHDREHVYRVLYNALDIASCETDVDYDVLLSACLLHDICRPDQIKDPKLCHARAGAVKAREFLVSAGFSDDLAERTAECIRTHRFRSYDPPVSIEARILFDADKLDVTGAIGIARTLMYQGIMGEPLYTVTDNNRISDGTDDHKPSFFQEYKFKLEKIYSRFYTKRGAELAEKRKHSAKEFYDSLYSEVSLPYDIGRELLLKHVDDD